MDKYIKEKITPKKLDIDKKQADFLEGLQDLKKSPAPVLDRSLSEGFAIPIKTDHIDTNMVQKMSSPSKMMDKIAAFRAAKLAGKKLLGAVPVVGGLASAAMTGDASAAIPGLDLAENVGEGSDLPMQDDTAQVEMLATSSNDPMMRKAALLELKNRK